ncbi:MAG: Rrf2 family transcriptional regulator [Anaerolineaceae bacterium]|nr:Rrf2 family transcriptional regulator [Anaerolineaceae bacterium]
MTYSLAFSQAIIVTLYVADKVEQGMFDFIPTTQLSDDLNMSPSSTSSILRRLNRAGLIETREGVKGGVRLAVPSAEVTVLDIFDAIEQNKPLFQQNVKLRVTGQKPDRATKALIDVFSDAEAAMKARLQATTIEDLRAILNA